MSKENFIKKFDELFRTDFHKLDKKQFNSLVNAKKKELGLKDLSSNNFLMILSYLYLESRNFSINGDNNIKEHVKNIENELKKLFRKPLICKLKINDSILIVTKRIKGDIDPEDLFKNVKAYNGSDIIYFNKKDKKITFTKGEATTKIKKIINDKKISLIIPQPKEVSFDPIEKILNSKKIDIFEVEFRSINFEKIRGLYLKVGSKETKINSKIKKIRKALLEKKILRISNIKKIHMGLKGGGRDKSASLIITAPQKLGTYKIKWKGNPPSELDNLIKKDILKGLLNVDLIDKEILLSERILTYWIRKEIRQDEYESRIKPSLNKWDKYKLLKYEKNRIKPDYINFEKFIKLNFKKDFIINQKKIKISKKIIKEGWILKQKENAKEIFLFLNKRGIKDEVRKILNKKLPVVIIDFYEMDIEENNRYNFLQIDEDGVNHFIEFIKNVCNNHEFYENQCKYFLESKTELEDINNVLNKIKDNQEKGAKWEDICGDVIKYIFYRTFILSGPSLPDGITFWSQINKGFLWDSKALFTKKLKDSIKTKNKKPKDLAYVEVFRKKLQIDYYIFLTCGVNEDNFKDAKKILDKYKKNVHFCCLTSNALLNLSQFFENKDKAAILHKNLDQFCDNLKFLLDKGYVNDIKFKEISKGMKKEIKLNKKELRKKIKKGAS